MTEEQIAELRRQSRVAVENAKRILKRGDRLRVSKCPGTKRWITFDRWEGNCIVSKSGISDYAACCVDRLNGEPVDFTRGLGVWPPSLTPLEEISRRNARRCEQSFHMVNAWTPNDWATALAGEVGELCNLLKKRRRGEEIPDKAIADEMADALLYLDLLATRCGISLADAVVSKFNEVSVRVGSDVRM